MPPLQNRELLPKRQVFEQDAVARAEETVDRGEQESDAL